MLETQAWRWSAATCRSSWNDDTTPQNSWPLDSTTLFPGPIGPEFNSETETNGPNADPVRTLDKADSHLALMSEAIQYVDQKKRS